MSNVPIEFLLFFQNSLVSTPWLLKSSVEIVYNIELQLICIVREDSICPALTPAWQQSQDKLHTRTLAVSMSRSRPLVQRCVIMRAPKTALLAVSKLGVVGKIS